MTSLKDRILRSVSTTDPAHCWQWLGAIHPITGYGTIQRGKRGEGMVYVHRASYEALVGAIPNGLVIDHLCRNRGCVNPAHLEPVTTRENVLRGEGSSARAARRNCCINGHAYTPQNTYEYRGSRQCRECRSRHKAASRARKGGGPDSVSRQPLRAEGSGSNA